MARTVTAIEPGHDAIKMIALANRSGMPELVGVLAEPLAELGRVEDGPEKLAALRMRLAGLDGSARLPLAETVTPVSGRTTMVRYVQIPPVPPWRLDALMHFEAEQQSPARAEGPHEVPAHDYRMLDVPDVDGQSLVLLALSQETTVRERTELAGAAGASDPDVDLASMGLFNAYVLGHGTGDDMASIDALGGATSAEAPGGGPDTGLLNIAQLDTAPIDAGKTVVLLDIGADETNMCIVRNGGLYFARHQPGGGRAFTEAVKNTLDSTWPDAEDYKRTRGRIYGDPGEAPSDEERNVSEALAREAADLARRVEAGLMYARAQTKLRDLAADRILLSGGGARLMGLAEFLQRRLRTEVSPLEPLRNVSLGGLSSLDMGPLEGTYSTFAVPLGLALARVSPVGARLDLRTRESKEKREFSGKGLFLWAASFVFALGMVFWIADALRDSGVYVEAREKAVSLEDTDKAARTRFDTAKGENDRLRAEMGALRERIRSGEDLMRALSQLKRRTPEPVRLIEVTTSRPAELEPADDAPDKEITFPDRRMIWLRGYARSTRSQAEAMREVFKYHKELEKSEEIFREIRQVDLRIEPVEPGEPETAYFVLAIQIAQQRW